MNMSWRLGNLTVFNGADSTSSQGSLDPAHGMMPRSVTYFPWLHGCSLGAGSTGPLIYDSQTKEGRQAAEPAYVAGASQWRVWPRYQGALSRRELKPGGLNLPA